MSRFLSNYENYDAEPEELSTPENDWDVIVKHPVVNAANVLVAHQLYPKGDNHSVYSNMYVVDRTFAPLYCGSTRYRGQVVYKGIADTSRPKCFQFESYGERSTYGNITSPISFDPAPHDVSQPRMGVTVKYVSFGRPYEDDIGKNITPPVAPGGAWGHPDNVFTSGEDVILSYPWGWVLEKRTGPNIPGTELWFIEDTYVYYYQWRPK